MTTPAAGDATDIRCAALRRGNFDLATRYDAERAWRFVIALTNDIDDDPPTAELIEREIGDCPVCLRAFARYLGGLVSGIMISQGGKEGALAVAGVYLDQVLDSPDLPNPPE